MMYVDQTVHFAGRPDGQAGEVLTEFLRRHSRAIIMNRDFQRIARLMSAYGNFALTVGAVQNSVLESVLKHGLQGKTEQHIIQQMLRDIYPDGKLLFYPEVHNFQIGIRVNQLIGQRVFVCRFAERISVEHSKAAGAAVVQAIRQGTSDTRSVDTETVRSYLAQQGAIVP